LQGCGGDVDLIGIVYWNETTAKLRLMASNARIGVYPMRERLGKTSTQNHTFK